MKYSNKLIHVLKENLKKIFFWVTQGLSDKTYLQILFLLTTRRKLHLRNPRTFNEKLQWLKLYDRKPEYSIMVDKIKVKKWVADRIGMQYIIPTFGVWERAEDIDFDLLPNKFVLKTNHDSGHVIICKDKSVLDKKNTIDTLNESIRRNFFKISREWPYKNVPRRIFAEKYLDIPDKDDLTDYKIYCFNGIPKYIQVIQDRNSKETIDFFDTDWIHQTFVGLNPNCKNADKVPTKPKNLKEMLETAKILADDIPFIRVDFYNIEDKVYFGELTFYPASGLGRFTPEKWSYKLGDMLQLPGVEKI